MTRLYVGLGAGPGDTSPTSASIIVLHHGLDGVEIGAEGAPLAPRVREWILDERQRQREVEVHEQYSDLPAIAIADSDYRLLTRGGTRMYPHILDGDGIQLRIGLGHAGSRAGGRLIVRYGSRICATSDPSDIWRRHSAIIHEVMPAIVSAAPPPDARIWVSSMDLSADIQTTDPREIDRAMMSEAWCRWVGHAPGAASWADSDRIRATSITIGYAQGRVKGAIGFRLENKTQEIDDHSGKTWWYDVWAETPAYFANIPVYRAEFRIGRDAIRGMAIPGASLGSAHPIAVMQAAPSIWAYCTRWCRYTIPTTNQQSTRWPNHPIWDTISSAYGSAVRASRKHTARAIAASDEVTARDQLHRARMRAIQGLQTYVATSIVAAGQAPGDYDCRTLRDAVLWGLSGSIAMRVDPDYSTEVAAAAERAKARGIVPIAMSGGDIPFLGPGGVVPAGPWLAMPSDPPSTTSGAPLGHESMDVRVLSAATATDAQGQPVLHFGVTITTGSFSGQHITLTVSPTWLPAPAGTGDIIHLLVIPATLHDGTPWYSIVACSGVTAAVSAQHVGSIS